MSISEIDFLARLATAIMSSCLLLIPAETALAVALVIAFVLLIISSAVTSFLKPSVEYNA